MTRRRSALHDVRRDLAHALALTLAVTLFLDVAALVVPLYGMHLYDRVLLSRNMDSLLLLSLACSAGLILYCALEVLRSAAFATIAARTERRLHGPLLQRAVRQGAEGDNSGAGEAMRDLNELRGFLSSGGVAVPMNAACSPLMAATLFMLHPAYGWLACAGAAGLVGLGLATDLLARPATLAAEELRTSASNTLAARLRDPELTEGVGMMPAIARRWAIQYGTVLEASRRADVWVQSLAGVAKLVRLGLAAGIVVLGAVLTLANEATPGSIMGASLLLGKFLQPFDQLVGSWRQWALARAAWQRTRQALAAGRTGGCGDAAPGDAGGDRVPGLLLAGVGYRAPDGRWVLRDIDAAAAPGEALCVSGPNGAGKSTLLRLLAGLAEPASGRILLDGEPLASTDGSRIGYLPQCVALLDGTVGENIARFAHDAGSRDVVAAAALADVHEMIGRLQHGYDTMFASHSTALSGGQRQRIGLARALFRNPRLLILDEPDANLDHAGEAALLRAILQAKQAGVIVVVTTHRAALMHAMDHVLTLGDGPTITSAGGRGTRAKPAGSLMAAAATRS